MKSGILYFNQGWTDIVNCLPLINIYSNIYDKLILLIRNDAKQLVNYYTRGLDNVVCFYEEKEATERDFLNVIHNVIKKSEVINADFLFHGHWDRYRNDEKKNRFLFTEELHFASSFYLDYGFSEEDRISNFVLPRDAKAENDFYVNFFDVHKETSVLVHDSLEKKLNVNGTRLNNSCANPLLAVKVLQLAKEIHLIDSLWAAVCYHLDSKYGLLKNVDVRIYPFKDRAGAMWDITRNATKPKLPNNWKLEE